MNTGKTLFAQLMDFLPWTTFTRIVDRYGGDHRVRTLSCAEQYRSMAFAQLTYRESLRDIETCLSVHASKLYHMGFRQPVRRSTLADANERRDWRIHAAACLSALRTHPLGVDCVCKIASVSILHVVCVCINRIGTVDWSCPLMQSIDGDSTREGGIAICTKEHFLCVHACLPMQIHAIKN